MRTKTTEKAYNKAKKLGEEADEKSVMEVEQNLSSMKKGIVATVWDKVLFLWEQAKSPEVPLRLKVTIIGALLYLILPADVIPDAIPGIGFIDDVAVIVLVFKEVTSFAVPKAVKKITKTVEESYFSKIDASLKQIFTMMLRNSIISLVINIAGVLMFVIRPFGAYSKYVGFVLFGCTFVFLVVRIILYLKQYGNVTLSIIGNVLKTKSLSKGISIFVQEEYPVITKIYAGIGIAQKFIPGTDSIPDFDRIVKDFIVHYRKRILLVTVLFAVYSAMVFVLKMYVIN